IAQTAEALIAVEGEYGTLSETAIGLKMGKPVVVLPGARAVAGTQFAESADSAVSIAFESLNK
ncbi:MAG: TIGR00725 family protein, partial [Desulfuromonadales bacterium]